MGDVSVHYAKAPLTEALIDVRVAVPDELGLTELAKIRVGEEERYPNESRAFKLTSHVEINAEQASSSTAARQVQVGFVYRSADGLQVCQVRLDGFTFSRLAPYDRWETLRDEARRLWSLYRQAVQPQKITRVAVRYINRLDLPVPKEEGLDFKVYLRTGPEVSPVLPQGLSGFFMQMQMPQQDLQAHLVLTEAMVPPSGPDVASVLLDIDLFREVDVPQDEDGLWALFETFRQRKNTTFEGCITDRLREMIRS